VATQNRELILRYQGTEIGYLGILGMRPPKIFRAQLSGPWTTGQLVTSGSIQSKVNDYFDKAYFTTPLVIGADGLVRIFFSFSFLSFWKIAILHARNE